MERGAASLRSGKAAGIVLIVDDAGAGADPRVDHRAAWAGLGAALTALMGALALLSPQFGYAHRVHDMPIFAAVAILVAAGALYLALPRLIRATPAAAGNGSPLLIFVATGGLLMRLVLLPSTAVLEDDYQRYLWDGAQTAHGLNPYATAPEAAKAADPDASALGRLARQSGVVLDRVNHPHLKTLYPPLAEAAFALAHWLAPWSLSAWRLLCLACDAATFLLLLLLLREAGRPAAWAALYWWNPLAAKEVVNSAHMDVLLLPLILGALLLAVRARPFSATALLVAGAGVKLWPALLLPLIWRPLAARPFALAPLLFASLAAAGLIAWPMVAGGLGPDSGLIAYARDWTTNSAFFPRFQALIAALMDWAQIAAPSPAVAARALIGAVLAALALALARKPLEGPRDLVTRAAFLVAALILLMPAQFPWYYLWLMPFLPFAPLYGLLVLTLTLPLYYAAFHFVARDTYGVYGDGLVWVVWLPAWVLLAAEGAPRLARPRPAARS